MKSQSFKELDVIVFETARFGDYQISDVVISGDILVLGLITPEDKVHFVVDVSPRRPMFVVGAGRLPSLKKETKPLSLFLKAHFLGLYFRGAERRVQYGRLVILHFENGKGEKFEIELHLFPQGRNVIARTPAAQISMHKQIELTSMDAVIEDPEPRTASEMFLQWAESKGRDASPKMEKGPNLEKIKIKKQKGLEDLRSRLDQLKNEGWQNAGEWLAAHRSLESVPAEHAPYFDAELDVQGNIDRSFEKAKQSRAKIEGVEQRLRDLEAELIQLQDPDYRLPVPLPSRASPLQAAKGRTKNFDNGLRAFIGKSAADNLKILRNAKSWYIWVHPKDLPGSHAVIALEKGAKLPAPVLQEVALWTLKESLTPKQWQDWQGVKCSFLYCECRFVTPIKGDKMGRVNYKNEKVLTLIVQE